ncbi:hypothetical protein SV7mr_36420 [Stieleria bergensis]|uniref:TssC1 N-terminal domain-containing protein n=1 Tax=Stieleria bergensis TaxID=2528025 RepID=A0A517SYK1_9BACT|nr:hypothetical protein SV7mr_36420 [Planctomycetes bacterium SV_7m_r]
MSNLVGSDFGFGSAPDRPRRDPESPLKILLIADLSGDKTGSPIDQRKPVRVDIDNFDDVMGKMNPLVKVPFTEDSTQMIEIPFEELESFEPDFLYQHLDVFKRLRDLRSRLGDVSTFESAATELRQLSQTMADSEQDSPASEATADSASTDENDTETLQRLLGATTGATQATGAASASIDQLIHQIVAPHVQPAADPRQDQYIQWADEAISQQLCRLLHWPAFQTLESNWRGLHWIVRELTGEESIQLFVLDAKKAELGQLVGPAGSDLQSSPLYQRLVVAPQQSPYAVVLHADAFAASDQQIDQLSRLTAVAKACGACAIAGASPQLLGVDAWPELNAGTLTAEASSAWSDLRGSAIADSLGLVGPRPLMRLPYGKYGEETDAIRFEEIDDPVAQHDQLLWGSPAIAAGILLGQSFVQSGLAMDPGDRLQLDDLPSLSYTDEDQESQLKPCAEVYLPEALATEILSHGIMPLVSFVNRNAVRVLRFQSIAQPVSALTGPWS